MNRLRAQVIALPSQQRNFWPVVFALTLLLVLIAGAGASLVNAGHAWEIWHHEEQGRGQPTFTKCMPVESQEGHKDHEGDFLVGPCDPPNPTETPTDVPPTPTPTDEPPTPTPTDEPPTPTPTDPPCEECDPTPTPTDTPPVPTPTNVLPECNLIPQYEQWRLVDSNQKEGYVAACYIISVMPPSVERQAQLCTACGDQLDQSENAYTFRADSWIHGTVYLNECTGEYVFIEDGGKVITEWKSEWFRAGFNDNIRTSPRCPSCEAKATAQANGG